MVANTPSSPSLDLSTSLSDAANSVETAVEHKAEALLKSWREAKLFFDWVNVPLIALIHIGAIAALFFFSWTNLIVAAVFYVITALGITIGYHRLLTHRSFKTPSWNEKFWAILGALALQGGPITWVALHRLHHNESDSRLDPHDISRGFFHAHFLWLLKRPPAELERIQRLHFAPELCRDPFYRWLEKYSIVPTIIQSLILLFVGGFPMVLWGLCVRAAALYHATWFVNSAAHVWGSKPFEDSVGKNNWWVALLAMGEGWHNNHHAFPSSARHGLRNWQIDPSWITIKIMSYVKLAKNIKRPPQARLPWVSQKSSKN